MSKITSATIAYWLLLASVTLILQGCGMGHLVWPGAASKSADIRRAEQLAKYGNYRSAADIYWRASHRQSSPAKEQYQLRAAELAVKLANYRLGQQYLRLINEQNLTPELLARKRITQSKIAIHDQQYKQALALLPQALSARSRLYTAAILELRAQAFAGIGDIYANLQTRAELSPYLSSADDIAGNHHQIWSSLALAKAQELDRWLAISTQELAGWIELSQTKRGRYASIEQLRSALDAWRNQHPQHPATDNLLTSILADFQNYLKVPEKIALLLPMSGRFAQIAEMIYAGIVSARQLPPQGGPYAPEISLYDTGDNPADILYYYQQAVSEGADFVIGPLKKAAASILAGEAQLSVPVLTLNYISDPLPGSNNLFQFGLLPEDEAQQVAERASLDGHASAIILTPHGEWGRRLASKFQTRFEELNGVVLDTQYYSPEDTDFSTPLKAVLQLNQSEQRYRRLRNTLGQNLQFEPRRRQDVDMIFMVASPATARLMRPQINYYFATDLPVYSTSHIFSGIENISKDRDINDVVYCDIPWLLQPSPDHELMREILQLETGSTYALLPRFAALGIDAYYLPARLAELAALPYERYDGLTGKLRIENSNRIFRELNWAKFINGKPALLPQFTPQSELHNEPELN